MRESNFAQYELVHINDTLMECNKLVTSVMEDGESFVALEEVTSWLITISFVYFHLKHYQYVISPQKKAVFRSVC